MNQHPFIPDFYVIAALALFFIFCIVSNSALAQDVKRNDTSTTMVAPLIKKDSLSHSFDSLINKIKSAPDTFIKSVLSQVKTAQINPSNSVQGIKRIKIDSLGKSMLPSFSFKTMVSSKPLIKLNGGYVSYNMNYRSNADTPFLEKNIQQHNAYGYVNLSVAGLPFNVNYFIQRSNSAYLRDINDIQVQFDPIQFRNNLIGKMNTQVQKNYRIPGDSLYKQRISNSLDKLTKIDEWLGSSVTQQKLLEYKELLAIPAISVIPGLPDSVNEKKTEQTRQQVEAFLKAYEDKKNERELMKKNVDSLQQQYSLLKTAFDKQNGLDGLKGISANSLASAAESLIPSKYRWLLNITKFGIGRNQLNYSELTSKNMSLRGINFEYNSWYYVAVAAGTVDYRFRDFVVNKNNRVPQYMSMVRLGIGRLENSHIIFSFQKGRKQLFATSNNSAGIKTTDITGVSVEAKLRLSNYTYLIAEAAESLSPDFRKIPAVTSKFSLADKSNKAFSFRFYSLFPKTFSKIEAAYKFTGANFQSFSSYQTNSEMVSWWVKADQQFLKKKLKVSLALKKNEFSNPYIIQAYSNNTLFKSIQITYRAKHFPVISAGFIPTSQITVVDSQFVENQFYSLNASLSHSYKIGTRRSTTAIIYNKFYNNYQDTSFLYYKAENIFVNQRIEFSSYTMNIAVSHSSNSSFRLTVLDAGVLFNMNKSAMIGIGVKVNEFNNQVSKTGLYGNLQLRLKKLGTLNAYYSKGFIPGRYNQLISNEMLNVGFIKFF